MSLVVVVGVEFVVVVGVVWVKYAAVVVVVVVVLSLALGVLSLLGVWWWVGNCSSSCLRISGGRPVCPGWSAGTGSSPSLKMKVIQL